ncbi:MAG TPA: alpha/beta hydrolase [Actinomycetota bacterium]|nr:alpha/beta hydrolase [Actinomycetota bacterium]
MPVEDSVVRARGRGASVAWTGWGRAEHTVAAGTLVHAAVAGRPNAPEVVCVHGLGCSHRYFGPFARALAPAARVVAPDLPGFGRTTGPREALDVRGLSLALAAWVRTTRRAGAAFVANSLGCQVVVDMAAHSPELVGPVVLTGPTMDPHARTAARQAARLAANVPFERPSLGVVLARDYLACGPRRFAATFVHALADPVERKLPLVRVPAVVARGARDPIVPRAWATEAAGLLPSGALVEVPGTGHVVNYSAPDELAAVTRDLLGR